MKNNDSRFENKITYFENGKDKYILKGRFQTTALNITKNICYMLLKNKRIKRLWIGDSIVRKQLGLYVKKWDERHYSDIDLFVLVDKNSKLKELNLIKKIYRSKKNRYFRISMVDDTMQPLKIFNIFSVDVWLFTPEVKR